MEFRTIKTKHSDKCPVCGTHPVVTQLIDYEQAVCDISNRKKTK